MDAQLRKSLAASGFTDGASPQLRAIVLDYLCHNSYTNTARAFSRDSTVKNVDADGDEIMSSSSGCDEDFFLSEQMLRQVEIRKDIRQQILGGHVEEAVQLLNQHFPTVLSESAPALPRASSPNKVQFLASTSVDPAHLSLNLRILAFIEACRTVPLEYKPPPATREGDAEEPSVTMMDEDPSSTASAPYDPEDLAAYDQHLNSLLSRVKKLYASAGALRKPIDRSTYLEELGQVGGLLAYKVPEQSPMAKYLSQARREAVADQINSAILYRVGLHAISRLELHTRYTTMLWSWMHSMKYELPPPRRWPPGVQPPPGNHSTDPSLRTPIKESREIVPAFDLQDFLDAKVL